MEENIKPIIDSAKDTMDKSITYLEGELAKIRAGKASPAMLDGIKVDYYGMPTPLSGACSISVGDARTLLLRPFEKKMIAAIERAILEANIGVTPQNDGNEIRISIPPLNEARRKELVKQAKKEGEEAKVAIRNIRQDSNVKIKKAKDKGVSEDMQKTAEKKVQDLTNDYVAKVDKILKAKEDEILTV